MSIAALDPASTYRQEAAELLAELETTLLDLESDRGGEGLVDRAFRALHTIKGSGAMFGFDAVAAFTHHLETAFDEVRSGRRPVTPELITLTLSSLDHIRALIEQPETAYATAEQALLDGLERIVAAAEPPQAAAEDEPSGPRMWRIRLRFGEQVMARGTNPLLLLDELRGFGDCTVTGLTEGIPRLEDLDPVGCYLAWDVVLTTVRPIRDIQDVFIFIADDSQITIEPIDVEPSDHRIGHILVDRGDVSPEAVETVMAKRQPLGALLVQEGQTSPDRVASALAEQQHVRAKTAPGEGASSVRVAAERLDSLMERAEK